MYWACPGSGLWLVVKWHDPTGDKQNNESM